MFPLIACVALEKHVVALKGSLNLLNELFLVPYKNVNFLQRGNNILYHGTCIFYHVMSHDYQLHHQIVYHKKEGTRIKRRFQLETCNRSAKEYIHEGFPFLQKVSSSCFFIFYDYSLKAEIYTVSHWNESIFLCLLSCEVAFPFPFFSFISC